MTHSPLTGLGWDAYEMANGKYARKRETSAAILCLCYKKLYICKARK